MALTPARINNNPLNLRPLPNGEKWKGQIGVATYGGTGSFCKFESNRAGVRAAVINMRSLVKFAGAKTLADLINRWAPPVENDTNNYLNFVMAQTELPGNFDMTPLTLPTATPYWLGQLAGIIFAMNRMEAGEPTLNRTETEEGIADALGLPTGYKREDDGNVVRENIKQSDTVKAASGGQVATLMGTGVSGVTAFSSIQDWRIACVVAAVVVLAGAGSLYYFSRVKAERVKMHEEGIA